MGKKPAPSQLDVTSGNNLDLMRDGDQPFIFNINFSRKKFTLVVHDTANPNQHWTTLQPDVVVLAFDISNRETLVGLKGVSMVIFIDHYVMKCK